MRNLILVISLSVLGFYLGTVLAPKPALAFIDKVWCHHTNQDGICTENRYWWCPTFWDEGKCPPPTHLTCVENACVEVEGDEANECETSEDCLPPVYTHLECVELSCQKVEGEGISTCETDQDCVVIEPTPAPTGEPHIDVWSKSEIPSCSDTAPEKTVANFHVYRNGDVAVLKWVPDGRDAGNKVNIYYKNNGASDWQYSVIGADNNGLFEVTGLDSLDITFGIQQVNGCNAGSLVSPIVEVVDGSGNHWTLFR